jgi:hypothetical protein
MVAVVAERLSHRKKIVHARVLPLGLRVAAALVGYDPTDRTQLVHRTDYAREDFERGARAPAAVPVSCDKKTPATRSETVGFRPSHDGSLHLQARSGNEELALDHLSGLVLSRSLVGPACSQMLGWAATHEEYFVLLLGQRTFW